MKIGIDARFVGPEGTGLGKYTEKLIENLVKIDTKNNYKIFLKKSNWSQIKLTGNNFEKVLADVPWYSLEEQLKMPGIYKSQNLDLLHVPHFNVSILYGSPYVVTIHDLIHHKFSQESATTKNPVIFKAKRIAYKKIIKNAILKSQKIITPSEYVKSEILTNFKVNPDKIVVTYEAAEEEYISKNSPTVTTRQSTILYVGNTYPHKNISNLLEAMRLLPESITLKIVCPRDVFKERLVAEIRSKNLENRVTILPYQSTKKLVSMFREAKAYVFPSLEEGFGIPGLSAMASGLPVVCSSIPTLKEVYQDAALYFDPKKPTDISSKIKKLLSSPKLAQEIAAKGKKQSEKYSWQKMAQETLKVYQSCL